MAMISIRARRFMNIKYCKFVGKKVGFDKSKVRCYNCEGLGHFSRECQRQKGESHQAFTFHNTPAHGSSNVASSNGSNALVSITTEDGTYDWSLHLEDAGTITQAFMAEISDVINEGQEERVKAKPEVKVETEEVKEGTSQTKLVEITEEENENKTAEDEK
ncbi:putative transcription factor interactor and regulator CCHC(Zn) family [Helianthus anomalus]